MPDFLDLPDRPAKPRDQGVTHVIDTGLSTPEAEGLMASAAAYVDLVRLGWGSAYVTGLTSSSDFPTASAFDETLQFACLHVAGMVLDGDLEA